jgi:hypothetical protein
MDRTPKQPLSIPFFASRARGVRCASVREYTPSELVPAMPREPICKAAAGRLCVDEKPEASEGDSGNRAADDSVKSPALMRQEPEW